MDAPPLPPAVTTGQLGYFGPHASHSFAQPPNLSRSRLVTKAFPVEDGSLENLVALRTKHQRWIHVAPATHPGGRAHPATTRHFSSMGQHAKRMGCARLASLSNRHCGSTVVEECFAAGHSDQSQSGIYDHRIRAGPTRDANMDLSYAKWGKILAQGIVVRSVGQSCRPNTRPPQIGGRVE